MPRPAFFFADSGVQFLIGQEWGALDAGDALDVAIEPTHGGTGLQIPYDGKAVVPCGCYVFPGRIEPSEGGGGVERCLNGCRVRNVKGTWTREGVNIQGALRSNARYDYTY
jgi:hypothetical protein